MDIPSIESFEKASKMYDDYMILYDNRALPLIKDFIINFPYVDIEFFLKRHEEERLKILNKTIKVYKKNDSAFNWLSNQPAFISCICNLEYQYKDRVDILIRSLHPRLWRIFCTHALELPNEIQEIENRIKQFEKALETPDIQQEKRRLSYMVYEKRNAFISDYLRKNILEFKLEDATLEAFLELQKKYKEHKVKIISSENINDKKLDYLTKSSHRILFDKGANHFYIASIAEISRMALWYLTEAYLEKVTTSKARIENIINALTIIHNELDILTKSKWYPENIRLLSLPKCDYRLNRKLSTKVLKDIVKKETQCIKRKDNTVQERLMIIDLIRTYKKLFQFELDKRIIYKIMELPFINNLIEMKTIERIIQSEKKNQEND